MFQPVNLAISSDNRFFIVDFGDNTVKVYSSLDDLTVPNNVITGFNFNEKTFAFPDVLIKPEVEEVIEEDVVVVDGKSEKLFVSDPFNHVVKVYNTSDLELVATLGGFGSDDNQFNQPDGMALDTHGYIHIVDTGNHRISVWIEETDGMFRHYRNYGYLGHGEDGGLYYPIDIVHYQNDIMYVTDAGHNRIVSFDDGSESDPYIIKKLDEYVGHEYNDAGELSLTTRTFPVISIETDSTNFYLTDLYTSNVVKFDASWVEEEDPLFIYGFGTKKVKFPKGMLILNIDSTNKMYVADTMSGEIEIIELH